jgi:hypothetical protein
LQEFLTVGRKSYAAYRNLGQLSWLTGRLDDAIRLFEMALARATEPAERAELHCQLFELLRRRGDTGKARLRHAVRYGALAKKEPENEARYLMMFMLTPISEGEHEDSEIKAWIAEFQGRLSAFSAAHPRFTLESETTLLARMAGFNFRYLPFAAEHLREALRLVTRNLIRPTSADMNSHHVLGPLLRQFGDLALTDESLARVSTELYVSLLHDTSIDDDVISELLTTVSFRMSQRGANGILSGVSREKPVNRLAVLWAFLVSAAYDSDKTLVPRVWTVIRHAAEKLFANDEKTFWKLLTETMPLAFYRAIIRRLPPDQAILRLVQIPQEIPVPERAVWEDKLFRWARRDRLIQ